MANKIFFKDQKSGYDIARRRLKKMTEDNILKMSRNISTNENVYYVDKKLSYHDLIINNFFAALINSGATINFFEKRKTWMNDKIRSDAFCSYDSGGYTFYNIIEVCRTHFKIPVAKYEELKLTGEAQQLCSGSFPRIILIDDVDHKTKIESDYLKIIQLNYNLDDFPKIFMD
jgi:hypothetical protein